MSARLCFAVIATCTSTACLVGDVTDIPCAVDDECPTDAFCHLTAGVCIATAGPDGAPSVRIVAIEGEDGDPGSYTRVPVDEETQVQLHVKNEGGYVAEEISIELSRLHCAPMSIEASDVPARLDPGKTKKVPLSLFVERECANPVPVDWFVRFSGREHRGVFDLFHDHEPTNEYPDQD